MKTLLLLLVIVSSVYSFGVGIAVPAGQEVPLSIANEKVKYFTRKLTNGQEQKFYVDGPNKGSWVDAKGKKVPSSNFTFKAPGTLVIKKASKGDSAVYDYEPLVKPEPTILPPGHHIDPQLPTGIELTVN